MGRLVKSEGKFSSPLVLIGEAPGQHEERHGRPFVGPSGALLNSWWQKVGLSRKDFFITNVYPYRPMKNEIDRIELDELEHYAGKLRSRLLKLTDPHLIIPTGNYALRALMGQPLRGKDSYKITQWRGSVLQVTLGKRKVKVIPTIHPAATFRQPRSAKLCLMDWERIAEDAKFPELRLPERNHEIDPTVAKVAAFKKEVTRASKDRHAAMAVDIETNPATQEIICVGFALTPVHSITLKFSQWPSTIKWLCAHPIAKVLQNGMFDAYHLHMAGIRLANFKWDTLALHHAIDATLPHDLATQASLYTREPYWKQSAKDEASIKKERTPYRALARYNGRDCCVTRELLDRYLEMLR